MILTWRPAELCEKAFFVINRKHSCMVLRSFLLNNGGDSLKYIPTPLFLLLLGWSAVNNENPLMFKIVSSWAIVKSKNILDKNTVS